MPVPLVARILNNISPGENQKLEEQTHSPSWRVEPNPVRTLRANSEQYIRIKNNDTQDHILLLT